MSGFGLHYGVTQDPTAGKVCTHARFLESGLRGHLVVGRGFAESFARRTALVSAKRVSRAESVEVPTHPSFRVRYPGGISRRTWPPHLGFADSQVDSFRTGATRLELRDFGPHNGVPRSILNPEPNWVASWPSIFSMAESPDVASKRRRECHDASITGPTTTHDVLSSQFRHTAGFDFFQVLSEPFANLIILAFGQLLLEFV